MRKITLGLAIAAAGIAMAGMAASQVNIGTVDAQDGVTTTTIRRTTLTASLETSGSIEAERVGTLSFDSSGQVLEVLVDVGDTVRAGQVLARLDTTELERQIALKQQSYIVQQTNYDRLVEPAAAAEIAQAEASVASARSQVEQARVNATAAPNQQVLNCTELEQRQRQYNTALTAWDDYVRAGYEWDATFLPDPDSEEGQALQNAQDNLNSAQAKCSSTAPASQYDLQLQSAQAQLAQAEASLASLLEGPSEAEIAASAAQLEQARLELVAAEENLKDAELVAPFDGLVASSSLVAGQRVSAGTTAMTIVDNSRLHIDVQVDELDIAQVSEGQNVIVRPDALDGVELDGVITRISPTSTTTSGVVTYSVRVDLSGLDNLPVRVGMTTEVEIGVSSADVVLAVDTNAIQRDGTSEFVEVLVDGAETRRIPVTTGQSAGGLTQISGSVEEGMRVVVPPQSAGSASGAAAPFFPGGGN
jgi:HlyD family secretion protein